MGEKEELKILLELMNEEKPQSYFVGQRDVYGSESQVSKALKKLSKEEKLLKYKLRSRGHKMYTIKVWSLKEDFNAFKKLITKFLKYEGWRILEENPKREFLNQRYLWDRLCKYRDKIDLPLCEELLTAFVFAGLKEPIKALTFYEEMINKIIEKTEKDGLFIPEDLSSKLILFHFKKPLEKLFTIHLTFSQEEISYLKTLMSQSPCATLEYLSILNKGQTGKGSHLFDPEIRPEGGNFLRHIRTILWWVLLDGLQGDADNSRILANIKTFENFKRIFGDTLVFKTEIHFSEPERIDLDLETYNDILIESGQTTFSLRKDFICNGLFGKSDFFKDINLVDPSVDWFFRHHRLTNRGKKK